MIASNKAAMLTAKRVSDGKIVQAYFEQKRNAPFLCVDCDAEVALRAGGNNVAHFAHVNPLRCRSTGESDLHRRCKLEIYHALFKMPNADDVALERSFGTVRPDVSAIINGVPVAIEVQISSLSLATILRRTIDYFRKGIYVLWVLQWSSELNSSKYVPKLWEKWIHAAYFGRVDYWTDHLTVVGYRFDPCLKSVPKTSWFDRNGKKAAGGGYTRRLKNFRTPVRTGIFNIGTDFGPRERNWWEGGGLKVPEGKLFMEKYRKDR